MRLLSGQQLGFNQRTHFRRQIGILQGFFFINSVITAAMEFEVVPPEHMGRWQGIVGFFRMLIAAVAALAAGAIWDSIGPQYVFLAVIGIDFFIRIPLLIGMPETRWR